MTGAQGERIEVWFPGDPRYLSAVRTLARVALEGSDPARIADVSGILLAIQEACVNAVRHGHDGDASRPVGLIVEHSSDRLEIRILDGGDGFTMPETFRMESDETSEGGRGLGIMGAVMDSVSVQRTDGATAVCLVKLKEAR